jgi:hypothetical protein
VRARDGRIPGPPARAVRKRGSGEVHAPSVPNATCGLIVIKPRTQPDRSDQIENALKTTCHIFSAYPRQAVT